MAWHLIDTGHTSDILPSFKIISRQKNAVILRLAGAVAINKRDLSV